MSGVALWAEKRRCFRSDDLVKFSRCMTPLAHTPKSISFRIQMGPKSSAHAATLPWAFWGPFSQHTKDGEVMLSRKQELMLSSLSAWLACYGMWSRDPWKPAHEMSHLPGSYFLPLPPPYSSVAAVYPQLQVKAPNVQNRNFFKV